MQAVSETYRNCQNSAWSIRARIYKHLRSLGIDSRDSIPPAYVAWRAGTSNRVVVPGRQAGNRFLGSLKGLQIESMGTIGTDKEKGYRTGPPGYIGWRNSFLGIDFWV